MQDTVPFRSNGKQTRQQPHEPQPRLSDPDSEAALLSSVLVNQDVLDDVAAIVTADDFADPANQILFGHLTAMHQAGGRIDETLLAARLKHAGDWETVGGAAYLYKIIPAAPNAAHAKHYAQLVRGMSDRRRLVHVAGLTIGEAQHPGDESLGTILGRAEARISDIRARGVGGCSVSAGHLMTTALSDLDARRRGEIPLGIPTGLTDLDKMIGGLEPAQLVVLGGQSSMGKTTLLLNIATHAAIVGGKRVLLVSLEMPACQLANRLLSSVSGVPLRSIREGSVSDVERDSVGRAAAEIASSTLTVDCTPALSLSQIAALARQRKRKDGLDVLLIDYAQKIAPEDPRAKREEQVATIVRGLKTLASELGVPVVTPAALNRDNTRRSDNRPRLSDYRETAVLEYEPDLALLLYREEYYLRDETPDELRGVAEIIVAKQRNGQTGSVKVAFDAERVSFRNLAPSYLRPAGREVEDFGEYDGRAESDDYWR